MALTRATDKIIANADGNLNLSGIVTASSFVGNITGAVTPSGDVNVGSNIKLGAASGIVTATSFSGDGSNLTSLPAGLGTALSSTQTSPLNKLYYTNEILSIGATVTVDHPATGTGAYTQYADIRLEEGADLIIEDGDDVIPDILGLGTDGGGLGAGGSGRIRVDSITNKNANGAPNFPNGLTGTAGTFTGAISAASGTITGNLGVGGTLTYEDVANIDSVGVITARSGINVSSGSIGINTTGGNEKLNTFGAIRVSGSSANFNAGLEGTLIDYDTSNRVSRVGHVNGASGSARSLAFLTGGGERLRVGPAGQIGLGGANYGSSGQVLTSQGNSSAVQWATPVGGKILQVVNVYKGDRFTSSSTSWADITGLSIAITPSSTSSKIMLSCSMGAAGTRINNGDYGNGIRVMRDIGGGGYSNNNKLNGAADGSRDRITFKGHGWSYNSDHMPGGVGFTGVDDPNTTSAVTYKVQVICQSSSYAFFLNGNTTNGDNSSVAQARSQTSLIAMEIGG